MSTKSNGISNKKRWFNIKIKNKETSYFLKVLGRKKVDTISAGEICALVGLDGFEIGDTIADAESPEALETIAIDEPTMSMLFTINDSPFFGKDGRKFVASRHLKERLEKELEKGFPLTSWRKKRECR